MERHKKVLACVDQSSYAVHVADAAAWAALALQADLELLHALDRHPEEGESSDHSGAIGFNAQEVLLTALAQKDEALVRGMREAGRLFLGELRERAHGAGVPRVDIRQRHGELQDTVMDQADGIDLLVIGRRGESVDVTLRDLGRNVERLIRSLSRPILTVTDQFRQPRKALIAFDGSAATRKCVDLLAQSPLLKGLSIGVVMAGDRKVDAQRHLDWAVERLEAAGFETWRKYLPGDPERVIASVIKSEAIDLLVMGAYSHSFLRSLFFGSKTNELLRSAKVPTLLVR